MDLLSRERTFFAYFVASCLFVGMIACKKPHAEQPSPQKPHTKQAVHKGKEDINARFLSPKLDVKVWQQRFEGAQREVWRYRQEIVEQLALKAGQVVADIGAGTGAFIEAILQKIGASGTFYAVDISPNFIRHLKQRAARKGWQQVRVVQNTATTTGLPTRSVDLVFICDTYHHFDQAVPMLADIRRALRPDGRLAIVDFHRIPGVSHAWILGHVRQNKEQVIQEITQHGFVLDKDVRLPQLKENYFIIFRLHKPLPAHRK